MAVAAPLIMGGASLLGSYLSSKGSKKAAANSKPSIPKAFGPDLGIALGLLGHRLTQGYPAFPGGAINPLQAMAMQQMGQSFGAGQAGLQNAQNTIQTLASTGIDPAAINTAQSTLAPYFDFLRNQGLAQTREGEAQGGRFFGSGGGNAEGLFNASFAGQQANQILPLAMQMSGLRLGAAQSLPGFMAGQQGLGINLFNTGAQAQQQQLSEFLRQQPDQALQGLASLMGSAPVTYNPIGAQFGQVLGQNIGSLTGSSGFWDYLKSLGASPSSSMATGPGISQLPYQIGGPTPVGG